MRQKRDDDVCCHRICLLITFLVVFVVGYIFYGFGCDSNLHPDCSRYYIKNTQVIKIDVDSHSCSRCIHTETRCTKNDHTGHEECSSTCTMYQSYSCYDSYALESFTLDGQQSLACKSYATYNSEDYYTAMKSAQSMYPLYSTQKRYVDKVSLSCSSGTTVMIYAYAGAICFLLAAVILVLYVVFEIRNYFGMSTPSLNGYDEINEAVHDYEEDDEDYSGHYHRHCHDCQEDFEEEMMMRRQVELPPSAPPAEIEIPIATAMPYYDNTNQYYSNPMHKR